MDQLVTPSKMNPVMYISPKRKRGQEDDGSPVPFRLRTDLSPRRLGKEEEIVSPRAGVVSQFQALDLRHEAIVPDATTPNDATNTETSALIPQSSPLPLKRFKKSDSVSDIQTTLRGRSLSAPSAEQLSQLQDSHNTILSQPSLIPERQPPLSELAALLDATPALPPPTPFLKPSAPPIARTISPLPSHRLSTPPSATPTHSMSISPTPSARSLCHCDSPPALKKTHLPIRPHSPPPPVTTAPDDDAFDDTTLGLTGVGFRPSPAAAYARAQRRKQQVADWKSREAREARQRRSERRRASAVSLAEAAADAVGGEMGMGGEERRRVRFVEG